MRIKTQFALSIVTFSIVLFIIGSLVVVTQYQIETFSVKENNVRRIQIGASDLSYISNNYFLYQDNSSIEQWNTKITQLSAELAQMNSTDPVQQSYVNVVKSDLYNLNSVFNGVITFLNYAPRNESIRILPSFQTQWNRMAVQTQALSFDSQQLSEAIRHQSNQATLSNTVATVALMASFGAFFVTIYLLSFRRTLKSIDTLKEGIGVIGSGNLDHKFLTQQNDEVADIARSVNQMAANLKIVTASKADLEKEVIERKNAEGLLKDRNELLEQTQAKLEDNACQLEEYASRMEELANQRLIQLRDSERLAAIGATAGMVGHDIRNPLQSILSDLYFAKKELSKLSQGKEVENINESLSEIESSVTYINKIVQDLQDFAKPVKLSMQEINLKTLCSDLLSAIALPPQVTAELFCGEKVGKLTTDPLVLKRILTNLLNNAVQATHDEGKITLNVQVEKNGAAISIADTGEGIPVEIREKLFTPLFTTKSKGQGFGLAVVKRMTEALGGTVTFESELGKGTIFTVHLPNGPLDESLKN